MKSVFLCTLLAALSMQSLAKTTDELAAIWDNEHITNILPSNVRHADLSRYLGLLKQCGLKVDEVGRSVAGRSINQIEWGNGPLKIFFWSQMHGDEPTATSALVDLFAILAKNRTESWVKALQSAVTLRAVPMINPDGAEFYIRRNLQGIDINRDALDLKTPEANILKKLRDDWSPAIGFNLHNQQGLTSVGESYRQAAVSFLVVYGDAAKTTTDGIERNKRLASAMIDALGRYIPQNLGKYGDEYTATAFGDNFTAWGTPVILIETGALTGRDEMYLVKMNFLALMTALGALSDGSETRFSPAVYQQLPANSSGRLMNITFRNATIVSENGDMQSPIDLGLTLERRRASMPAPAVVRAIGKLASVTGLDDYDASQFYVYGRRQPIKVGSFAELLFYKRNRQIDWSVDDVEAAFAPDAVFSVGRWVKGQGVVPKS